MGFLLKECTLNRVLAPVCSQMRGAREWWALLKLRNGPPSCHSILGAWHDYMDFGTRFFDPPEIRAAKTGQDDIDSDDRMVIWHENFWGETAMTTCASVGNVVMLYRIVEAFKPDMETTNWNGRTLISLAAEHGQLKVVLYLLSIGCDPIGGLGGDLPSALSYAAQNGHKMVLAALLPLYERNQVLKSVWTSLAHHRLTLLLLLLESDAALLDEALVSAVNDKRIWEWLCVEDGDEFVLFVIGRLVRLGEGQDWFSIENLSVCVPYWTLKLVEDVEWLVGQPFRARNLDGEFWTTICRVGNIPLLKWLDRYGMDPNFVETVDCMICQALKVENIEVLDYLHQLWPVTPFEWDGREGTLKDSQDRFEIGYLGRYAAKGGPKSLDWLFSHYLPNVEKKGAAMLQMCDAFEILKKGASAARWIMEHGGREAVAKWEDLALASLDTSSWPTKLSPEKTLEAIKAMSEIFEWSQESLEQDLEAISSFDFLGATFVASYLPPLAWAVYFRLPKLVNWLLYDKNVNWRSLDCGNEIISSICLYTMAIGYTGSKWTHNMEDRFDMIPMLRYLRYGLDIPLPTDASAFSPPRRFMSGRLPAIGDVLVKLDGNSRVKTVRWLLDSYTPMEHLKLSCSSHHPDLARSAAVGEILDIGPKGETKYVFLASWFAPKRLELLAQIHFRLLVSCAKFDSVECAKLIFSRELDVSIALDKVVRKLEPRRRQLARRILERVLKDQYGDLTPDTYLSSLLMHSLRFGSIKMVNWLYYETGASLVCNSDTNLPKLLCSPIKNDHVESLRWLQRHGLDVTMANSLNPTPTILEAIRYDSLQSFKYLVHCGSSLYHTPLITGRSVLDVVRRSAPPRISHFLAEVGVL